MKKYKTFLFDLDGTMYKIDWYNYKQAYFQDVAECANKLYGIDTQTFKNAMEDVHNHIIGVEHKDNYSKQQIAFFAIVEKLGLTIEQLQRISEESKNDNIKNVQDDCVTMLEGVINACKYLKQKGYKLILATNSFFSRKRVLERLAWTGISSDTFEFINDWTQTDSVKPDTKFFENIVEKFNLNKEECLFIGNNKKQDGGCLNAGIDFYLVTNDIKHPEFERNVTYQGDDKEFYSFVKSNF